MLLLMNGWLSQTELECFRISEFVSVGGKCTVESKATASTTASPTSEGLSAKQLVSMRERQNRSVREQNRYRISDAGYIFDSPSILFRQAGYYISP